MIQLQQQLGQPVDASALAEAMEAIRPHRELVTALPDWYVVTECMREYHWTEKQFWEDNSPAMIIRLLWLESVYVEKQKKESPSASSYSTSQVGRNGMDGTR